MLSASRGAPHPHGVIAVVEAPGEPSPLAPLLRQLGAVLFRAADEHELLVLVSDVRPDLVIVHVGEGPTPLEGACQRIRNDPLAHDLLLLEVTKGLDSEDRALPAADAIVTVPTSERELRAAVRLLLRAGRSEEAARRGSMRSREPL